TRIPSTMIMDEAGRGAYPVLSPTFNDRRLKFDWSDETLRQLEARILHKAGSLDELAALTRIDKDVLASTIAEWNAACARGVDEVHGRPPTSMVPVAAPPY